LRDLPGAALTDVWMAFDPVWSPQWVWLRYATALRATAVLLVLALAALVLRRAPASARAGLWACALLAVLPLPLVRHLPAAAPLAWRAHVVPEPLATPMVAVGATMVAQSWPGAVRVPWTSVVGVVWAVGAGLLLARLAWGWAALAGLSRGARPLDDPAWRAALADARAALGMRRRVRLLSAPGVGTPLTWGTLRPTVLVPADAAGGAAAWPAEHRRAVLLHELAHVRRLDCLLAVLAHGTCAAWWFHPGVWWAAHRLRLERERACDERVLLAGVRPSDYAECLLRIADRARPVRPLGPAVVAAGFVAAGRVARSHLGERLRAILAPAAGGSGGAARRRAPGRLAAAATACAGVALVATAGTVRLAPHPAVLWTALGSPSWATRATAAESIARFGDARSVARLHAVLRTERDPRVPAMARFGATLRAPALGDGAPFGRRQALAPAPPTRPAAR
jgi:beta-lactamase regulating signal transducer with metallopeptidase domain